MKIEVIEGFFDPYEQISRYQAHIGKKGKYGAITCFIGTMRDFNESERVHSMTLEYYPGMTEKHLAHICEQAGQYWPVIECLLIHRVGQINIGDSIVLVAVWSAHRGDAMDACRFIIENLKSKAPFWKKEKLDTGNRWVEKNSPGHGTE